MLRGSRGSSARLGSDTYLVKLLEGLSSLRSQSKLCDVTLEAEGVRFPAHKIILASASNYCKVLFVGNLTRAGSPDGHIQLKAISAAGLRNVLNFIYSNKLDLSLQNIEETFKAAETLLVREVMKLCFRFLEDCLNCENCLDVLNIAKKLGPAELRQKAMCYVGQHYKEILADPQRLKDLDRETLCEILNRTDAEGCSELELFRAAVSWLQHDCTRLKDAADILRRVRLPLIHLQDLQRYVQELPLMRLDPGCRRYLREALDYHSQLYAQPVLQTRNTNLRSSSTMLLVAGGRTADNCVCREMWVTDQSCGTWRKVGDLCVPLYNHCVAVINDFLFVIGGQCTFDPMGKQPSNEVFRFDPRNTSWLQVASMLERRTRFHADVLTDRILAVGGGTLLGTLTCTVELYQPTDNKWEFTAPFPTPIADHAGATHKGILYISGGFSGGKTLRDTYSYLPRLRRWIGNSAMAFTRCDHGMAAARDKIFCIGGRTLKGVEEWIHVNETEYYCPVSNQWTTLTLPPFSCCQFSITAHDTTLYLAGGGSLQHMRKEDSVFLYDTEKQVWKKASRLPKALVDHASCMIKLSPVDAAGEMGRGTKCSPVGRRKKSTLSLFIAKKQESRSTSEKK
ncbi:LOW QUALITY PROTEIN: kelch-like protein 9 [Falco naumanni]|uniref:LOW QUALITY PROTEIN: kelch-like protein 9 n=1 Tax=Falco naumanni TaxID=148594 RepID=UPI001ADE6B0D|nr:LOW QUALITY PROTEIN: kelch-like protein 9 [Falco naumanni]